MLKRKKRIIAKVMATTMLATTLASTFAVEANAQEPRSSVTSSKISGDDRYKTAVEISKNYSSTSKHAVVVNGQKGIVDALTATPYASLKKAPILMTQNNKLNEDTKKELTRRGIKTVDIIGGTASVSDSVKAEIEKMGITVNRIAGNSKYETSLKVAKEVDKISNISKIAVANGEVLADAVSVAAPAAQNKMPIILAHPSKGLDDATKTYIKGEGISTSYVIGGTSSVSNSTQNSLPGTKKRLEGTGRQETNAKVVKEFYDTTSHDNIYVTKSGQVNKADEIADALAVGVLAAHNQDPVLIVGKNLAGEQKTLLEGKDFDKITEVGNGIPAASIQAIKDTQSSVKNVTTVAALNSALSNAKDGDVINFKPSSTVSESITLSTSKNVTVNLDGTHSGNVTVNMASGNVNINGNITGKVSVDAVKTINIKSGVTVKHLEIKSSANKANIVNKGTVTTFDVLASGVVISGSGNITTLNPQGDTEFSGVTGEIGNLDISKPVSQVTVQNSKEIVVRFSKALDVKPTLEVKKDGQAETGLLTELSENRMTMTITAPIGKSFDGSYDIKITGMKNNNTNLDNYTTTVVADDKTAPQISSVTFNQNTNKFEITLSEPIDAEGDWVIRINGIPVENLATLEMDESNPTMPSKKITIVRNDSFAKLNTTASVHIAGIKDFVGNLMQPKDTSVSVNRMNLDLESVQAIANNKIRIKFTKALNGPSSRKLEGANQSQVQGLVVNKTNDTANPKANYVNSVAKNTAVDSTGRTYDITLNDVLSTNKSQALKVVIAKDVYTDETGVSIGAVDRDVTINKDETKPTITSTNLSKNKDAVEVTFSEAIDPTSLTKEDLNKNIKLMKNTLQVTVSDITIKDEKTIVVKSSAETTNGKLNAGHYKVYFAAEALSDLSGNKINSANSAIVEVVGTTAPTTEVQLKVVATAEEAEDQKVTLPQGVTIGDNEFVVDSPQKFDYNMFASGKNPNTKFKIGGKEIPTNSEITFTDNMYKQIKVTLPEDYVKYTGNYMLEVSGLELESKDPVKTNTRTIALKDNSAPTLKSAKLESVKNSNANNQIVKYELKLTFDENIELYANPDDIKDILPSLTIKTGNDTYTSATGYACNYEVVNGNELKITIEAERVANDESWKKTLGSSYSTTLEVSSEIDAIRDTDSIEVNGEKLKARKVSSMTIVKSSRIEKL